MEIIGAHHVALITANFDNLRSFYIDTLGLPLIGAYSDRRIIFIGIGAIAIELIERDPADNDRPGGWGHVALEVADVDATHAELSSKGVPFHITPRGFPSDEAPLSRIAFFRDPDGNELQLVKPLGSGRFPAPPQTT